MSIDKKKIPTKTKNVPVSGKSGISLLNNKQRRKNVSVRARKRNKRSNGTNNQQLTVINNQPIQTRSMRYIGTIATLTDFRVADFTRILMFVISGSTNAYQLVEAFRIRSIGITCLPSSSTNSGTFAFTWAGEREPHTVQTMIYSQGVVAKWSFHPPEGSLASFWYTRDTVETTSSVFTLDPDNDEVKIVLDLHFEYTLIDGPTAYPFTLSAPATFTGVAASRMPAGATDELLPVDLYSVTI